jgi:hypothetical protein
MKSKRIEDLLRKLRPASPSDETLEVNRAKADRTEQLVRNLVLASPAAELREHLLILAHRRAAACRRRAAWQPVFAFGAVILLAALDFWVSQAQVGRLASISGFKDGSFRFVPPYVLQQQIAALMEPERHLR